MAAFCFNERFSSIKQRDNNNIAIIYISKHKRFIRGFIVNQIQIAFTKSARNYHFLSFFFHFAFAKFPRGCRGMEFFILSHTQCISIANVHYCFKPGLKRKTVDDFTPFLQALAQWIARHLVKRSWVRIPRRSLLAGSVSVQCEWLRHKSWFPRSVSV